MEMVAAVYFCIQGTVNTIKHSYIIYIIVYNLPVLEIAGNALLMTFHVATDAYVATHKALSLSKYEVT